MTGKLQPEVYPVQFLSLHSSLINNNLQFAHLIDKANKNK